MILSDNKKMLLRWCGWFFLGNVFLFSLVGLNYVSSFPRIEADYLTASNKSFITFFIVVSYVSQFALFTFALSIIQAAFVLVIPEKRFIFITAILMTSLIASLIMIDSIIYQLFRFHMNGFIFDLILKGDIDALELSFSEQLCVFVVPCLLLLIESVYGVWLWRFIHTRNAFSQLRVWSLGLLGLSVFSSYLIFFCCANRIMLDITRVLPLYTRIVSFLLPRDISLVDLEGINAGYVMQPEALHEQLAYPPSLQCKTSHQPLNIVFIVIDTWRFDMLKPEVMPFLFDFSKQTVEFKQNFSGGNATGPGMFSIFYGIPSTYWASIRNKHIGPVFIDEMLRQHYQMGIFSSSTLAMPALNETVFSVIKNLQIHAVGDTADQRDNAISQKFKKFIVDAKNKQQPFFSFLFYDSVHAFCMINNVATPFQPATKVCYRMSLTNQSDPIPYLNRYKNAVHYVDHQLADVIGALKNEDLLKNTVIVITADHGEEFNESHLGYWGHSSNFLRYQVQTPLIIYWPGMGHAVYSHRTSHYDIVPTLMSRIFNCQEPANEYSIGTDLFDKRFRPYIIVSSYIDFGVIEKDKVTTIYPSGNIEINQIDGGKLSLAKLDSNVMGHVFQDLRKFYKP